MNRSKGKKQRVKGVLLSLLMMICLQYPAWSQGRLVSGIVRSAGGEMLSGVSVKIKGTSRGTTTDQQGAFRLSLNAGEQTLVFSYLGYREEEVAATTDALAVTLESTNAQMQEVVVTALGIKKEQKSLGYSVQQVSGKAVSEVKETNVINSLSGRVAGLQLYQGAGGPGGSSKIVLRGFNSLGGNNEPLIVVDGMPLKNEQTSAGTSLWGGMDRGSDISNINPDDIESISVLKGPSAAALYGSRGGNGVILITTKKGAAGKVSVNVNSSFTSEKPLIFYDFQNQYGQGNAGLFNQNKLDSWGPKITGQTVTDWKGAGRVLSADPNGVRDFFQHGHTWYNTVDFSGGTDLVTYRFAYTKTDSKSILPGYTYKRDNATMRVNAFLFNKKLSIDGKIGYVKQMGHNRPYAGGYSDNIFYNFIQMPRTIHLDELNPATQENGMPVSFYPTAQNPYWVINRMSNNDNTERFMPLVDLEYKFTDWLKLKGRYTMDYAVGNSDVRTPMNTIGSQAINKGSYSFGNSVSKETNADFLLTAQKKWSDFSVSASVGGNRMKQTYNGDYGQTTGLVVDELWNISNSPSQPYYTRTLTERAMNSLYGFANLSYGDLIFFDYTYRRDWSSTLPSQNRMFDYPSYSGSIVLNDALKKVHVDLPSFISYLKVRGSIAQAGNDTRAYLTAPTYQMVVIPGTSAIGTELPNELPNYALKPEIIKAKEAGFDLYLLNNRVKMDMTWYKKNAFNQVISLGVSTTTGYNTRLINAGNVQNKGVEFSLTGTPVKSRSGLTWDITVNYAKNRNKMVELHPEVKQAIFTYFGTMMSLVLEGKDYGDFYGTDYIRNDKGQVIVDADGLPKLMSGGANAYLGNFQPKWNGGVYNRLSFKNLNLGFLIDIRAGGNIYSGTLATMYYSGTAAGTLAGREGMVVDGVHEDGSPNKTTVTAEAYWKRVAGLNGQGINSAFVYD
ncbi:MAG: SusC/RagA family TonB-linked outer membrane protein, partial [Flavisolibacter sp.]